MKFALSILLFILLISLGYLFAHLGKELIKAVKKTIKEKLG